MSEPNEKKGVGADLLIPGAALLFTLYYFSTIWNSPWTAQVSAFVIGSILIGLIVIFAIKTAIALGHKEVDLGFGGLLSPRSVLFPRIGLFLATLCYVILIQWGGFTLTTGLFLFASMLILGRGRRKRLVALISIILSISGYLLFIVAFDTRFPRGPFEQFMRWLF